MSELSAYPPRRERMLKRPPVRKVVEAEHKIS